jgi:hypothetical protein
MPMIRCGSFVLISGWCALVSATTSNPRTIYVSSTGADSNSGTSVSSALATCAGAVRLLTSLLDDGVPPLGGIEVVFAGGTYPLTPSTACGSLTIKGNAAAPVIFRRAADTGTDPAMVVFNGATTIGKLTDLQPVTNNTVRQLLNPDAAVRVMMIRIGAGSGWSGVGQQLQWGENPLTSSVW